MFYSTKTDLLPLLKLVLPLILAGIAQSSNFFFQTLFLAHLGPDTLAAGALASWLYATLVVISFGTMSSINILIAHKHGANDQHGISLVVRDGFLLALVVAIPSIILLSKAASMFLLMGQHESIVTLANHYLQVLAWSVIPNLIMVAFLEFIIGIGKARLTLITTLFNVLINLICSYLLIFGKCGLPELGITGAGWGNILSCLITTGALMIHLLSKKYYRPYFLNIFSFREQSYLWELIKLGVPIGLMFFLEVGFFLALTLAMGTLGELWLAANQITMQYMCSLMGIIFSVAQGITVRMSYLLGKKDTSAAKRAAFLGVALSGIFMLIIALLYWVIPETLISIDFNTKVVQNIVIVQTIKKLLMIAALFQIVEAMRIALFGALRALKDTKFTLLASLISFWGIAIPVGFLLAKPIHLQGEGFWWGMTIGATTSALLLYFRFKLKINYFNNTIETSQHDNCALLFE